MVQAAAKWISSNRLLAGTVAMALVTAVAAVALLTGGTDELGSEITQRDAPAVVDGVASPAEPESDRPADDGATGQGGATALGATEAPALPGVPGEGTADEPCVPQDVDEIGVDDETITIGQIVTDSNQLPQQLRPAAEGLRAFVELVNGTGGLCGRRLVLDSRNDNLNPATHRSDYQDLAERAFAFVANESLLDNLDYSQNPPFEPNYRSSGGFVPDVGGLAFSYNRGHSQWHAGVIGSVSPVLVGGGQYRYFLGEARERGAPCRGGGVVYLREPTGASEDQARLGAVSLEASWGGDLGEGNTQLYAANLVDPIPAYEVMVDRMLADGMNCVFAYTDLQSSINLALAMSNRGAWPPDECQTPARCFSVTYIPLSAYDPKFVQDAGPAAREVSTFVPHLPLTEPDHPAMQVYLRALETVPDAQPSTFSILGFASGQMFVEALAACPAAPTRECLMSGLRRMEGFTAGGLLGGTTPFRTTTVTFERYGPFDWKHIFNHTVAMRVVDRGGGLDFYRINPAEGFFEDTIRAARGTPG